MLPALYEAVSSATSCDVHRLRIAQDERKHFNGFATALQSRASCLCRADIQHITEQAATNIILKPYMALAPAWPNLNVTYERPSVMLLSERD